MTLVKKIQTLAAKITVFLIIYLRRVEMHLANSSTASPSLKQFIATAFTTLIPSINSSALKYLNIVG